MPRQNPTPFLVLVGLCLLSLTMPWLLDTTHYMPRGLCGDWPPGMRATWIGANALVALAYFLIPVQLVRYRAVPSGLMGQTCVKSLFAAFILLCGLTHLTEIAVFYWPAYRLFAAIYFATGLVSMAALVWMKQGIKALSSASVANKKASDALGGMITSMDSAPTPSRSEVVDWMAEHQQELMAIRAMLKNGGHNGS